MPCWMSGWTASESYTGWTYFPSSSMFLSVRRRQRNSGSCSVVGAGQQGLNRGARALENLVLCLGNTLKFSKFHPSHVLATLGQRSSLLSLRSEPVPCTSYTKGAHVPEAHEAWSHPVTCLAEQTSRCPYPLGSAHPISECCLQPSPTFMSFPG